MARKLAVVLSIVAAVPSVAMRKSGDSSMEREQGPGGSKAYASTGYEELGPGTCVTDDPAGMGDDRYLVQKEASKSECKQQCTDQESCTAFATSRETEDECWLLYDMTPQANYYDDGRTCFVKVKKESGAGDDTPTRSDDGSDGGIPDADTFEVAQGEPSEPADTGSEALMTTTTAPETTTTTTTVPEPTTTTTTVPETTTTTTVPETTTTTTMVPEPTPTTTVPETTTTTTTVPEPTPTTTVPEPTKTTTTVPERSSTTTSLPEPPTTKGKMKFKTPQITTTSQPNGARARACVFASLWMLASYVLLQRAI